MDNIDFFTAIQYGNQSKILSETILEKADNFFAFDGKKATVIRGHEQFGKSGVRVTKNATPLTEKALKIVMYCTIILPLIVLAVKVCARIKHNFYIISTSQLEQKVPSPKFDVVIIGAGPIGITTACALKALNKNLRICVVDKRVDPTRNHGLKIQTDSVAKIHEILNLKAPDADAKAIADIKNIFKNWENSFVKTNQIELDLSKKAQELGVTVIRDSSLNITKASLDHAFDQKGGRLSEIFKHSQVVIGADGTHSVVRQQVMGDKKVDEETMQYIIELKYQTDGKAKPRKFIEAAHQAWINGNLDFESMGSKPVDSKKPATLHIIVDKQTYEACRETNSNGQVKGIFGNSWTLRELSERAKNNNKVKKVYQNLERYIQNVNARGGDCHDEKISTLDVSIFRSKEAVKNYKGKHVMLVGDAFSGMVLQRGLNKGLKEALIAARELNKFFHKPQAADEMPAELAQYQKEAIAIFENEKSWAWAKNAAINAVQQPLNICTKATDTCGAFC